MSKDSDSTEVHRIDLAGVNAYLVHDGDLTLVDAGWPWSASSIGSSVAEAGYGLGDVDRVLVTHYDLDHVGGLSRLRRRGLEAPVYCMEPDASFLEGEDSPPWRNRKGAFQRLVGVGIRNVSPVERAEDGGRVGGFVAVHTPGHTPGHTAYLHDDGAVFLGDLVRGTEDGDFGTLPSLMSYDTSIIEDSIRALSETDRDLTTGYPGHGEPVEDPLPALLSV